MQRQLSVCVEKVHRLHAQQRVKGPGDYCIGGLGRDRDRELETLWGDDLGGETLTGDRCTSNGVVQYSIQ